MGALLIVADRVLAGQTTVAPIGPTLNLDPNRVMGSHVILQRLPTCHIIMGIGEPCRACITAHASVERDKYILQAINPKAEYRNEPSHCLFPACIQTENNNDVT